METKQDIIFMQEHWQFHPDHHLVYNDNVGDGWLFVTASSWKNSVNASIGGIGILLSPRAQKSLNQVEKYLTELLSQVSTEIQKHRLYAVTVLRNVVMNKMQLHSIPNCHLLYA